MSHSAFAVQQAVYTTLTGDATLMGMVAGVHDFVPPDAAFPYITLGENDSADWSAMGAGGQAHTVVLHVWSRARGRKETHEIIERLYALLHDQPLSITGHSHVLSRFLRSDVTREPDGLTHRGVFRIRIWVRG